MNHPALLLSGGKPGNAAMEKRRDDTYLAMQAAIEVGQYLVAEQIRRVGLLLACALCGDCNPTKPKPLSWQVHELYGEWASSDHRWVTYHAGCRDSFLCCWHCAAYRVDNTSIHHAGSTAEHRCTIIAVRPATQQVLDPQTHQMKTFTRGPTLPERWLCELTA